MRIHLCLNIRKDLKCVNGSGVNREIPALFSERLKGKVLWSTQLICFRRYSMVIKIFRTNALTLHCFWLILCFIPPTVSFGANIVWSADNETGDLSQWTADGPYGSRGGSYDNGDCIRPPNGITNELSHTGNYSVKMSLGSWAPDGG